MVSVSTLARTLVAVHAHPDDETVTMGGTLAKLSVEGVRTVVITCTNGDLATIFEPSLVGQDVARLRSTELACATQALGVNRVVELGYGDSGMPGAPENSRASAFCATDLRHAATRVLQILVEEQPDVVVTYDETGGYTHPDHIRAHQVTRAAFEQYGQGQLCFVRFPLGWSREFVRALRAAGIDAPGSAPSGADAGPSVTEIGVPDDLVTDTVDVRDFVPRKCAALACHASQFPPSHFLRRMPLDLALRLWGQEFYSRAL